MTLLRFLRALVATNLRASIALRGAFWLRAGFMFLNNFIFLIAWVLFFRHYKSVLGWQLEDTAAVYGICAGAFGLSLVFGGGVRHLARMIAEGDLDSFLTQPKPVLLHAVGSSSEASGWGDLLSAIVLFALCGYVTPAMIPVCVLVSVTGALIFLASMAMFQSLAFWVGDHSAIAQQAMHFILTFALYPKTIFTGMIKVVLFTAIPAGLITFLPVELLRDFRWSTLGIVLGSATLYVFLAGVVFQLGLRRYESGNRFGVRA